MGRGFRRRRRSLTNLTGEMGDLAEVGEMEGASGGMRKGSIPKMASTM